MILQPVTTNGQSSSLIVRENIALLGMYDSVNRTFTLPEPAIHNPPQNQIKVYHGGRRLNAYEYIALESVSGSGQYDIVQLTQWAPGPHNQLVADYVVA